MKKRLLTLLIACTLVFSCTGCGSTYQEAISKPSTLDSTANGYFTVLTQWGDFPFYEIVYANDTKVKYLIVYSSTDYGITPLYNSDGTLQIYNEGENDLN